MKITVKKAVSDLEKIVPSLNDLRPFQLLKEMAGTVAIGTQGIEVDGLMKDYEAHIKEELDKNSPSELDIDPDTHPSYVNITTKNIPNLMKPITIGSVEQNDAPGLKPGTVVKVTKEELKEIKTNPDKLVDALRKKLQEK